MVAGLNGFAVGDWVWLKLAPKHLRTINGRAGVITELIDPDNDLWRVQFDEDGSKMIVDSTEMVPFPDGKDSDERQAV